MPTPLYGFLEGDTIGLLILADEGETIESLAGKLKDAASIRVAPPQDARVLYRDQVLAPELTVAQAGMQPLERFDVIRGRR